MSVTTSDLAKICKVSRGSVDRALNGRPGVSKKTKELVLKTAEELGYQPNQTARSLVTGKTMCLGVLVFDLKNSFFAELLNAIEKRAKELGYFVYITMTGKSREQEMDCLRHLNGRVDGIILCPVNDDAQFIDYLQSMAVPVITVLNALEGRGVGYVGIDQRSAMFDATRTIIGKGYKRVLYYSPPLTKEGLENIYAPLQRYKGFQDFADANPSEAVYELIKDGGYQTVYESLCGSKVKTAVLCSSDIFALGLMQFLKGRGINIPSEAGIMGFDCIGEIKLMTPALSTVAIDIEKLGASAVDCLLKRMQNPESAAETMLLPYEIIPGQTII